MARILDFGESAHRRLQNLLPWYQNGTLEPVERAAVEAHLRDCESCRAELTALEAVVRTLEDEAADGPAEAAFARIRDRLEDAAPVHPAAGRRRWLVGGAIAAQFAVIAVLGAALWQRPEVPAYRTLSDAGRVTTERLFVRFDPARTEADVRAALQQAAARVVDGPTPDGVYVVESARPAAAARAAMLRGGVAVDVQAIEVR